MATQTGPAAFPRYVAAQLHCHSSIEGPASIGAHCYEAARAGVEVVWLTDHDTRISLCIGGPFLEGFDFESPALTRSVERAASGGKVVQRRVGWHVLRQDEDLAGCRAALSRERCYRGTQSLCLEASAGATDDAWRSLVLEFKADAKLHSRPLLAGPTVGLAVFREPRGSGGPPGEAPPEGRRRPRRGSIWCSRSSRRTCARGACASYWRQTGRGRTARHPPRRTWRASDATAPI